MEQKWLTTQELKERFEIPLYISQAWAWKLALKVPPQAQKLRGRRGLWLIAPEAVQFLIGRKGKLGRPSSADRLQP